MLRLCHSEGLLTELDELADKKIGRLETQVETLDCLRRELDEQRALGERILRHENDYEVVQ